MLGPDQPVILHLLDIEPARNALDGVKMELLDAAFPLLHGEWRHGFTQWDRYGQLVGPCYAFCIC